jgi:DNA-directed RNA polymerase beta' subunit
MFTHLRRGRDGEVYRWFEESLLLLITKSGLSWGFGDLPSLPEKDRLIEEANKKIELIQEQYEDGLLTNPSATPRLSKNG